MRKYKIVTAVSRDVVTHSGEILIGDSEQRKNVLRLNDIILISDYDDDKIPRHIGVICDVDDETLPNRVNILLLDEIGKITLMIDHKKTDEYDEKPILIGNLIQDESKMEDKILICSKIVCDDIQQLRDAYETFIGGNIREIVEDKIKTNIMFMREKSNMFWS